MGGKSSSSRTPLCYQIATFWEEGGRPGHTIRPLASAKTVTLTNSQHHNGTVAQFVFSFKPHYAGDTKAAGPPVKTCQMCHSGGRTQSCISSLPPRTRKGWSCCFFFLIPRLITHTHSGCLFSGGGGSREAARGCGRWVYDKNIE